jgi:PAS domain S-box-containing protein
LLGRLKLFKIFLALLTFVILGSIIIELKAVNYTPDNTFIENTYQFLRQSISIEDLILVDESRSKLELALPKLQITAKTLQNLKVPPDLGFASIHLENALIEVQKLTLSQLLTKTGQTKLKEVRQNALLGYQDVSQAIRKNQERFKSNLQTVIVILANLTLILMFSAYFLNPVQAAQGSLVAPVHASSVSPAQGTTVMVSQVQTVESEEPINPKSTRIELERVAVALRESKARNLAITRAALDAIITVDQLNHITEFNPAAEQIFEIPFDLVLGRNLSEVIFPPHLRARYEHRIAGLIRNSQSLVSGERLEMVAARVNGKEFPIEFSIVQLGDDPPTFASFIRDITERKAAEERLKERTSQLDSVFNVSPDGFLIFDANGKAIDVNPAFLAMTGLERNLVIGNNEYMISDEHEINSVLEYLSDPNQPFLSSLDASESQIDTLTLIRPNLRVLKRTLRVMRNQEEVPIGRVMYLRDVTHETEVSRMKSEFLATAAHELRTPMASIYGFAELLMMQDFDESTRKDLIETIHRQANRLVNLLNELLDLARIEARTGKDFKIVSQPIASLIEATATAFSPADQRQRLEIELPPDLPSMAVDGAKFQQALGNVISNAFKYSPNGGAIKLSILEPQVVDDLPSPFQLGIAVRDHGLGLTGEQLSRVFERFYRADDSGNIPGTGLGLNLVKEIIERHGGQVEIQSQFGEGTEVILWFPRLAVKA